MSTETKYHLDFESAAQRLKGVIRRTPLEFNQVLSDRFDCEIYLKREDLQVVRSYKLRGAYNMISQLNEDQMRRGIVCASAGNHAQGVAFSCKKLGIRGVIFMPEITPNQKVKQTQMFGNGSIDIILVGDTFDDCLKEALAYTEEHGMTFVPPFDNERIVEGQGTVGVEIYEDLPDAEVVIMPIGGGGLAAGAGTYLKQQNPNIILAGVEPEGAPSMFMALEAGEPITLAKVNRFVDGASVKRVGSINFEICQQILDDMLTVPEGKICTAMLKLYNEDAIVVEPAGALSVAVLDLYKEQIRGKKVVCIISGGNNDIDRMQDIKEQSLLYEGLKHYFIVRFPQRPGALKLFVSEVLGPHDDITRFEFIKKTERESGPALVGIELRSADDYKALLERMEANRFEVIEINRDQTLFEYLV
ncbi:threonine ammonia-lyase IlvA [Mucilaginibacter polytrichastri]|uniref:L-threonine dehydratase n=1 Tax=Mucilaginibacter polytrichastri TaxID=1302689 RepID=A0A1Q6A1D1_9SPHI|nr:threonine ammonia-lyase IlvA [Mucilaginibacter polytrichastri]OKS87827.1 L-threonine dehydratase biosynthetic IlvA [Mucilaginibacter polytrichastri]SFT25929.1 L-threonine ammonia-lyase [Mucilaginibacter polytrichastri]